MHRQKKKKFNTDNHNKTHHTIPARPTRHHEANTKQKNISVKKTVRTWNGPSPSPALDLANDQGNLLETINNQRRTIVKLEKSLDQSIKRLILEGAKKGPASRNIRIVASWIEVSSWHYWEKKPAALSGPNSSTWDFTFRTFICRGLKYVRYSLGK